MVCGCCTGGVWLLHGCCMDGTRMVCGCCMDVVLKLGGRDHRVKRYPAGMLHGSGVAVAWLLHGGCIWMLHGCCTSVAWLLPV